MDCISFKPVYKNIDNFKFSKAQKEEIFKVIEKYCDNKNFDNFISIIEEGVSFYFFGCRFFEGRTLFGENISNIKKLISSVDKLKGNINLLNDLDRAYLGSCDVRNPHSSYDGNHMEYINSFEAQLSDLKQACALYFEEEQGKYAKGFKQELFIVDALYMAINENDLNLEISKCENSPTARLINMWIKWLEVESQHTKKRPTATHENNFPSATGKSLINSWLRRRLKDNGEIVIASEVDRIKELSK